MKLILHDGTERDIQPGVFPCGLGIKEIRITAADLRFDRAVSNFQFLSWLAHVIFPRLVP